MGLQNFIGFFFQEISGYSVIISDNDFQSLGLLWNSFPALSKIEIALCLSLGQHRLSPDTQAFQAAQSVTKYDPTSFQNRSSIQLTLSIFKNAHNRKDNCIVVKNYDYPGTIEHCEGIFIKRALLNYVALMRHNGNRF